MQEAPSKPSLTSESVTLALTEHNHNRLCRVQQSHHRPSQHGRAEWQAVLTSSPAARMPRGDVPCSGTSATACPGGAAPALPRREPRAPQGAGQSGDLQRSRCSRRWLPLLGTPSTAPCRGTLRQAQPDTGALAAREGERRAGPEPSRGIRASRSPKGTLAVCVPQPEAAA